MNDTAIVPRKWYQAVGPGIITACVVIGPGSILSSSRVGASTGFDMLWLILISCIFMMFYMTMGAKLGVVLNKSVGDTITEHVGRWLAVAIGIGVFLISASYQFGNNLGVQSAFKALGVSTFASVALVIVLNALSISFLYLFKNMYKALEKIMMCFVGMLLFCFAINLINVKPNVGEMFAGFIPSEGAFGDINVLALVGTTFVISAAYFQAYLAQQKGWNEDQLRDGVTDARVGTCIMFLITIMLICTAAAQLRNQELGNVEDVAAGLKATLGNNAKLLFCLGLFSAAYSSFLVNSMIAGFILSDGLGLGSKPTDRGPKHLTTIVLLTGMVVALSVIQFDFKPVHLIVLAQAVTVIFAPLLGVVMLWLTNKREVMGERVNGPVTNLFAGAGCLLLLAISCYMVMHKIPQTLVPKSAMVDQVEESTDAIARLEAHYGNGHQSR